MFLSGLKLITSQKHEYESACETETGQGKQYDSSNVQDWDDAFLPIRCAYHSCDRSVPDDAPIDVRNINLNNLCADVYLSIGDRYGRAGESFDTKFGGLHLNFPSLQVGQQDNLSLELYSL